MAPLEPKVVPSFTAQQSGMCRTAPSRGDIAANIRAAERGSRASTSRESSSHKRGHASCNTRAASFAYDATRGNRSRPSHNRVARLLATC
eukprot:scaffold173472_cov30-Tisochrysis_lutea.AAC.2